jgi:hypothetical protein
LQLRSGRQQPNPGLAQENPESNKDVPVYDFAPEGIAMKYAVFGLSAIGVIALLLALPLSAHHEITAKFDPAKTVTLKGIVTKLDWANPHVHVFMNVQTGTQPFFDAFDADCPVRQDDASEFQSTFHSAAESRQSPDNSILHFAG